MIQKLSLRAKRSVVKQSQYFAVASFRFPSPDGDATRTGRYANATFAMTIGHFFLWRSLKSANPNFIEIN
ncbi:hypothetical protein FDUTEX481_09432 [Tolypothrix sp. PCC 7601]|nr:hypothetical protein FDUTEX481_09432 [Tolypothrix sp. PCC 7601]